MKIRGDAGALDVAFGYAVATGGDVDGDGFADVAVGGPSTSTLTLQRVEVFRGRAGGLVTPSTWTAAAPMPGGRGGDFGYALAP